MDAARSSAIFRRIDHYELSLCLLCNRAGSRRNVERLFVVVSRLGDGVFWYGLIAALPFIYGPGALRVSLRLALTGVVCVLVYKTLKSTMVRQRPFILHKDIRRGTAPLDLYSFPSGHTLHAVAFSSVSVSYYPGLVWLVLPFAALVAMSRVVLGLHFPSDVAAGAVIGLLLARLIVGF